MKLQKLLSLPFLIGISIGAVSTGLAAGMLGSSVFPDAQPGSFYDEAVGEMYNLGIIKGFEDGTFRPDEGVTRAQVAVMMKRLRDEVLGITPSSTPSSSSSRSSRTSSSSSVSSSSSNNSSVSAPPQGMFQFAVPTISIPETTKSLTISIARVGGDEGTATVKWTASGTTATAGEDFTAGNGTVEFGDGITSKNISISLKDDTKSEGLEKFVVKLSSPTGGAVLGNTPILTVSLLDNEASNNTSSSSGSGSSTSSTAGSASNPNGTFVFAASGYSVDENEGTLTVTVLRSGGTNGAANVNYATVKGSASNSTEYTDTSGTLNFAAGETSKTFTVQLKDDTNIDGDKNFTINLSSPTGGANIGTPGSSIVTLVDNENLTSGSGAFRFSATTFTIVEGQNGAVTISRVGGTKGTATITYNITAGSALPGVDYTASSNGTMTFSHGEGSKVLLIYAIDENKSEDEETAYLNLSSPTNATLGSPFSATLKIQE